MYVLPCDCSAVRLLCRLAVMCFVSNAFAICFLLNFTVLPVNFFVVSYFAVRLLGPLYWVSSAVAMLCNVNVFLLCCAALMCCCYVVSH